MKEYPIENLVIDGESDDENQMSGCESEVGFHAPFALFSPDLQQNVGGPYAERAHAEAALTMIKQGGMVPYTNKPVTWTIGGKPSEWYNQD